MKGFSLLEFILVIALFSAVAAFMFPISMAFYNNQTLNEIASGVQGTLRTAHAYARTQRSSSSHGVKFLTNSYVHFTGSSYDARDVDSDITVVTPSSLQYSGADEIVFAQYTGKPSATGTVTLSFAGASIAISVYEVGFVE